MTQGNVSIHAPSEGSDPIVADAHGEHLVSIHAPSEGSDGLGYAGWVQLNMFQSTLPVKGATPTSREK